MYLQLGLLRMRRLQQWHLPTADGLKRAGRNTRLLQREPSWPPDSNTFAVYTVEERFVMRPHFY